MVVAEPNDQKTSVALINDRSSFIQITQTGWVK